MDSSWISSRYRVHAIILKSLVSGFNGAEITLNKPIPELGQYTYRTPRENRKYSPSRFYNKIGEGSSCCSSSFSFSRIFRWWWEFSFLDMLDSGMPLQIAEVFKLLSANRTFQLWTTAGGVRISGRHLSLDPYDGIANKNLSRAIYKRYMNGITTTSLSWHLKTYLELGNRLSLSQKLSLKKHKHMPCKVSIQGVIIKPYGAEMLHIS